MPRTPMGDKPRITVEIIRRRRSAKGAGAPKAPRPAGLPKREPNGRRQRESVAQIKAVALAGRRRHGLPEAQLGDSRAGSVLGRLNLSGEISDRQYEAGLRWARAVAAYARLMEIPLPTPRSCAGLLLEDGRPLFRLPGEDESDAARVRQRYDAAFAALLSGAGGRAQLAALRAAVILDRPADIGDLRSALNVLAQLWWRGERN